MKEEQTIKSKKVHNLFPIEGKKYSKKEQFVLFWIKWTLSPGKIRVKKGKCRENCLQLGTNIIIEKRYFWGAGGAIYFEKYIPLGWRRKEALRESGGGKRTRPPEYYQRQVHFFFIVMTWFRYFKKMSFWVYFIHL